MFAQIEINVFDRSEDLQTLEVRISKNGLDPEASMMLRGQFNFCDRDLMPKKTSIEAALQAVRSTLRCGERFLSRHLSEFAQDTNAPVIVLVGRE